ncbi:IlvD/Edd family dehydratase [Ramlibacter sp.]|uniref:IlvD/Edd family dehydratase n=1 Tax=Ramlibacter sp. TaxID=1917967 RepID=UPI002FCAFAD3
MSQPKGMKKNLANYGDTGFSVFLRKVFLRSMGYSDEAVDRPVIGITDTSSGFNACHRMVPDIIEAISRGITQAGGLPVPFPVMSLQESFISPNSMYLRNMMAMDTEELIRAQPMDAVVLIGGCDKTVPALLMGAASAGVPAIQVVSGPMLAGSHRGERLGACTDCRRFWGRYRAEEIDQAEIAAVSNELAPTAGTCMVMGTASSMACIAETLGMMLPGGAAIPSVYAARLLHAEQTGTQAVRLAASGVTPAQIMTPKAFENAMRVLLAIGGSTNAIIHLAAIAGRLGIRIDLRGFDRLSRETPMLLDLRPSGEHFMEDLYKAGGLTAVLRELKPLLHLDVMTINGRTLGENLEAAAPAWKQHVVRPLAEPLYPQGGMAVLWGNLAPTGAIIKQSACSQELMQHTGRAVVFSSLEDLARRIDDPDLDVTADDVLVLQGGGPRGAPGMPEAGYLPIPKKLAVQGVKDMVRLSDARMSGTAFGTIVVHVTPESAIGGPLGLVRNGDRIRLDVPGRQLELLVDDAELARRRAEGTPRAAPVPERGYGALFAKAVMQAGDGCDFDFLVPPATHTVPRA